MKKIISNLCVWTICLGLLLGTLPRETGILLIETITTRGTPWGMVEFFIKDQKYRAYTGMKRIDVDGPVAQGSEEYSQHTLKDASDSYYGPGYDYARRKSRVKAGTIIHILRAENGFWLCDYPVGKSWVRAYLPVQ